MYLTESSILLIYCYTLCYQGAHAKRYKVVKVKLLLCKLSAATYC